jgi:hypothetical protein
MSRSTVTFVILFVILAVAALGIGVGLKTAASSTTYACFSLTTQDGGVQAVTSGIIHIDGSQYYVTCPEGSPSPTTSNTYSCLSIAAQLKTFTYPDSSDLVLYYLSAGGNSISLPSHAANATEILPNPQSTITVSC